MAEITLVKGEISALDRTWMSMPDGSTRQVAVHVVHDLPHLVVESMFGIEDGLWGVLAQGGFAAANRARTRSWQDGPDTPDGVRGRLSPDDAADADYRQRVSDLLGRLDDETIALAIGGTRELGTAWARLPAGDTLRLQWPLRQPAG